MHLKLQLDAEAGESPLAAYAPAAPSLHPYFPRSFAHGDTIAGLERTCLGAGPGGSSDETSGLMLPGAQLYRMRPFEVGLFKGDAYPNNSGRGAVHRSPRADESTPWRVRASLDQIIA